MKPTIAVPYDFGEAAQSALAWASDLHRALGGPSIRMVHVINPFPGGQPEMAAAIVPTAAEVEGLRARMLQAAAAENIAAKVDVVIRPVPAGVSILDVVNECGADLIVMGTHGRKGVPRLLLGSVAEHVVRNAECPVVTVRAHEKA